MNTSENWIESTIYPPDLEPQAWTTNSYKFHGHDIKLTLPTLPDRLLDDPAVQRESYKSDYVPYWAYVWPSSLLVAEEVLGRSWTTKMHAIEIGCGLGLAGLAALAGGMHVTFTDYSPAALTLASHNARQNGFEEFDVKKLDWHDPPKIRFDLVLGADVLYEQRCLEEVLGVLDSVLDRSGEALIGDPNRSVANAFPSLAQSRGYTVYSLPQTAISANGLRLKGRLFQIQCDRVKNDRTTLARPNWF